jgi:hypothetical protein
MPRATVPILVAAVAVLAIPMSASAAKPIRDSSTYTHLYCPDLASDAGSAYVGAFIGEEGASADLAFWSAPADPDSTPPTWNGYSTDVVLGADGSTLEIRFNVYEPNESDTPDEPVDPADPTPAPSAPTTADTTDEEPTEPVIVGEGTLSATLTPSGDPGSDRFRDRYGNHQYRFDSTWQQLSVTGTLALPNDIAFDLTGCEAFRESSSVFATDPKVSTGHWSSLRLSCEWWTDGVAASLFAYADARGASTDMWVEDASGSYYGWNAASLTKSAFDASVELYSAKEDESESAGSAAASASLETGDRFSEVIQDGARITVKGTYLSVDGSLTIETPEGTHALAMDDGNCQAANVRISELPTRPVHYDPVDNDAPEDALPLLVGETGSVVTGGAQAEPEAPCLVGNPETGDTYEVPIGYTAWWSFTGTGGSLTIETAGSGFDTVVGVYLADGTAVGEQVGCVDDVDDTLEARLTVDTVEGTTYLVQAGGYGGGTGTLVVAITEQ